MPVTRAQTTLPPALSSLLAVSRDTFAVFPSSTGASPILTPSPGSPTKNSTMGWETSSAFASSFLMSGVTESSMASP